MKVKLSTVNTGLLAAIILVNGYVIALPFIPSLVFWFQKQTAAATTKKLEDILQRPSPTQASDSRPNSLIVPSMFFDQPILEGKTEKTMNQGLWRRPATSTPDKGGNTVLVGHRFTYANPEGTLYHLDKVAVGDTIGVVWEHKSYLYKVSEIRVVSAQEVSIEAPTPAPQLTIYTCTPLLVPKDRLVVIAKPEAP